MTSPIKVSTYPTISPVTYPSGATIQSGYPTDTTKILGTSGGMYSGLNNKEVQQGNNTQVATNVLNVTSPLNSQLSTYTNQANNLYQQGQNLNLADDLSLRTNFQTTPLNLDNTYSKIGLNNYSSQYDPASVALQTGYNPNNVSLQTSFNPYSVNLNQNYSPELLQLLQSFSPESVALGGNFAGANYLNNAMSGGIDQFGQQMLSRGYQDINARQTGIDNQLASSLGTNPGNQSLLNVLRGQGALEGGLQANALYGDASQGTLDRAMSAAGLQNQYQGLMNQAILQESGFNQDARMQAAQFMNDARAQQTGYNNQELLNRLNFGNQNQLAQAAFNQDSAFNAAQFGNESQLQQQGFNNQNLLDLLNFYNQNTLAETAFNQDSRTQAQQLSNQDSLAQANYLQNQENTTTQLSNIAKLEQAGFTQQANFLRDQLYNTAMLQQYGFNQQASLADLQAQLATTQPSQNLLEALTALQGQQRGVTTYDTNVGARNFS